MYSSVLVTPSLQTEVISRVQSAQRREVLASNEVTYPLFIPAPTINKYLGRLYTSGRGIYSLAVGRKRDLQLFAVGSHNLAIFVSFDILIAF